MIRGSLHFNFIHTLSTIGAWRAKREIVSFHVVHACGHVKCRPMAEWLNTSPHEDCMKPKPSCPHFCLHKTCLGGSDILCRSLGEQDKRIKGLAVGVEVEHTSIDYEVNKEALGVKQSTRHKHASVDKVKELTKEAKGTKRSIEFLYHAQSLHL